MQNSRNTVNSFQSTVHSLKLRLENHNRSLAAVNCKLIDYHTPPWFFKKQHENNSRRSADTTIPASKEMEKEK